MAALKFANLHNMVAFLDKPTESDGFEQNVDFLNTHPIKYALTVNPTIYTSCIEQFWDTTNVKNVNEEVQIQALVDKKKVIITEASVRSDLQLEDDEGVECLPNATIFKQLTLMGYENLTQKLTFYKAFFSLQWKFLIHTNLEAGVKFLMYPRFVQVFLDKQVEGMSKHKGIYVIPSHTKKVFANMKRQGKDFSGRVTPLYPTMVIQAQEEKKQSRRKQRKGIKIPQSSGPIELIPNEAVNEEHVPKHSNDPLLSGEDRLKLNELMELCTTLQQRVLDLENTKITQALEIESLKRMVKSLEKKKKSRTHKPKILYKVGFSRRVESSNEASLGDQEDASKQGRKIANINQDADVTLVDETQGRNDKDLMFDTCVLDEQEVKVEKVVSTAEVTTASATTTTVEELTLAQTLIKIKAAKPKAVTTAAITTTTAVTTPKAKGISFREPVESTPIPLPKPPQDKDKAKMIEP
ncbi:hypothetical protein Tco_0755470 [Tanacetum coccineum]